MQESNPFALRANARSLVDELNPRLPASLERPVQVVYRKADVVDSRAAAGNEPADRGIRVVCLQQLHQRLTGRKPHYARPIGIIELYSLEPEHIAKKGHALA